MDDIRLKGKKGVVLSEEENSNIYLLLPAFDYRFSYPASLFSQLNKSYGAWSKGQQEADTWEGKKKTSSFSVKSSFIFPVK